ncbi:hypothetical protein SAMN05444166_7031 [Singulisphaera sp. GP187]|nr:hypothetical protein SAMN05444166_7031 [Singulisphaera sp. GP187]
MTLREPRPRITEIRASRRDFLRGDFRGRSPAAIGSYQIGVEVIALTAVLRAIFASIVPGRPLGSARIMVSGSVANGARAVGGLESINHCKDKPRARPNRRPTRSLTTYSKIKCPNNLWQAKCSAWVRGSIANILRHFVALMESTRPFCLARGDGAGRIARRIGPLAPSLHFRLWSCSLLAQRAVALRITRMGTMHSNC